VSPVPRSVPLAAALLLLAGCTGTPAGPDATFPSSPAAPSSSATVGTSQPPAPMATRRAEVVYVSDGDTIGIRFTGQDKVRPVRLLGIDTPETKDPDTGIECGGPAASRALTRLLPRGAQVTLLTDPQEDRFDKFGRLLRYVDTKAQGDLGQLLLRRGLARYYVYNRVGVRYARYRTVEEQARKAERGSWRACPDFGD
jgi:micrococcal nuclease